MRWISIKEQLPPEKIDILIYTGYGMYVATIELGITEEQRKVLREQGNIRAISYHFGDIHGNNMVPYRFQANAGPMEWFGQDVTHWMPLPEAPDDI